MKLRWRTVTRRRVRGNHHEKTAVYWLRDKEGHLLYVGISNNPDRRFAEHAADKPWWSKVTQDEVRWYNNRETALLVEREEIRTRRPAHNIVHNPAPQRRPKGRVYRARTLRRKRMWIRRAPLGIAVAGGGLLGGQMAGWYVLPTNVLGPTVLVILGAGWLANKMRRRR